MKIDPEKCLICDSGIKRGEDVIGRQYISCVNGCVSYIVGSVSDFVIFVCILFDNNKKANNRYAYVLPSERESLQQRIAYWKENDRYLLEIMEKN